MPGSQTVIDKTNFLPWASPALGFTSIPKKGSHIKLRRVLSSGARQIPTIVNHSEIDRGTLAAIYRQALRFIPETDLEKHFYSD